MLFADKLIDSEENIPRPLRVAVIGTGFADRVQLPGFHFHAATDVVAICSRREARAKSTADKHGIPNYYTDYKKMITTEKPDVVSIVTPPNLHLEMSNFAVEHGAHVLCEKPLAMNVKETRQMVEAAKKHNKLHVVNHEFRYLPARFYQKKLLDEGYVGTPLYLECTHLSGWRMDASIKWTWWSDKDAGGGMWGALGSHYIDTFRWWLNDDVKEISCTLHTPFETRPDEDGNPKEVTADEGANAIVEMKSGIKGIINLHSATAGDIRRLTVHGTEGALVVRDDLRLFGRKKGEKSLKPIDIPQDYFPPAWNPDNQMLLGPFVRLIDLMVEQIHQHQLVDKMLHPPTFADGIAIQRVLDAGRESHDTGQRVLIDYN